MKKLKNILLIAYIMSTILLSGCRSDDEARFLRLSYRFSEDNDKTPIITLALLDNNNMPINESKPGSSAVITIPLYTDFMKNDDGSFYNAVEYIGRDSDDNQDILPRSFVYNENLYIYFNRPGDFRLILTEYGNSNSDISNFLKVRNITLSGTHGKDENEIFVKRGEMYDALLGIHWVENLFYDISAEISPFEDILHPNTYEEIKNRNELSPEERMSKHIIVGQHLGAFSLVGNGKGYFEPNRALERGELFKMLAGYIKVFDIDVDGLLSLPQNTKGLPDDSWEDWQREAFNYLREKQFVPHRHNDNGNVDIFINDYVTLQEAQEILFMLITTVNSDRRECCEYK